MEIESRGKKIKRSKKLRDRKCSNFKERLRGSKRGVQYSHIKNVVFDYVCNKTGIFYWKDSLKIHKSIAILCDTYFYGNIWRYDIIVS
jgi:hypothetical protein